MDPVAQMWRYPMLGVAPQPQPQPQPQPSGRLGKLELASFDEPKVTEHRKGRGRASRKRSDAPEAAGSEDESSKFVSTSSGNELAENKQMKISELREINNSKSEVEASLGNCNKPADQNAQPSELPKQDFIHVRARRGQATDSHSLAERARREKISERMKILQDLVPGCNKVIGKASVLDEIINYIQALQHQVEFLSMKLEAVNYRIDSSMEGFPPKYFGAHKDTASSLPLIS